MSRKPRAGWRKSHPHYRALSFETKLLAGQPSRHAPALCRSSTSLSERKQARRGWPGLKRDEINLNRFGIPKSARFILLTFGSGLWRRSKAGCPAIKPPSNLGARSARPSIGPSAPTKPAASNLARWAVTSPRRSRARICRLAATPHQGERLHLVRALSASKQRSDRMDH
jgi:hypothetical protein